MFYRLDWESQAAGADSVKELIKSLTYLAERWSGYDSSLDQRLACRPELNCLSIKPEVYPSTRHVIIPFTLPGFPLVRT